MEAVEVLGRAISRASGIDADNWSVGDLSVLDLAVAVLSGPVEGIDADALAAVCRHAAYGVMAYWGEGEVEMPDYAWKAMQLVFDALGEGAHALVRQHADDLGTALTTA